MTARLRPKTPPVVDVLTTYASADDMIADAIRHAFPAQVDGPTVACVMGTSCTRMVRFTGGFDLHHPWPMDTGGPANQAKIPLCPNHHRRQHAFVRYFIECALKGVTPDAAVTRRISTKERPVVNAAVADWQAAGRPAVTGWPCPAAAPIPGGTP